MPRRSVWIAAGALFLGYLALAVHPAQARIAPEVAGPQELRHDGGDSAPPVAQTDPDAALFRHQMVAFLADFYKTIPERPDAPRPPLGEAVAEINGMSDAQAAALEAAVGPLVTTWNGFAQVPAAQLQEHYGPASFGPQEEADLEELRADMLAYLDRFEPYEGYGAQVAPSFAESMADARDNVEDLTLADLDRFQNMMSPIPTWRALLDVDPATVIPELPEHHPVSHGAIPDGVVPATHIHPQCNDYAFGPIVTAVLNYLANTGEDLMEIWSNDFFIAVAGFGANAPNIPKIVTTVIWIPLKLVALAASTDLALFMNCHEGYHQILLQDHDQEMFLRTNMISSTLTAHDLDMNNRLDRVSTFHDEYRTAMLRLAAEEDLLRKADKRLSLFQIPQSECITTNEHEVCGLLEFARDVVADTIQTGRNLGYNMTNAQTSYDDGVLQQAQGHYKEAYTRYREAYVLAVRAH